MEITRLTRGRRSGEGKGQGDAPLNIIRQYTEQQRHPAQATPGLTRP
jgi:hypothetical protein